jgi:hypothetical protein
MPPRSRARRSSGALADDPEIRRLYGVSLAEFIAARNALATRLRKAGQEAEAEAARSQRQFVTSWRLSAGCGPRRNGADLTSWMRRPARNVRRSLAPWSWCVSG